MRRQLTAFLDNNKTTSKRGRNRRIVTIVQYRNTLLLVVTLVLYSVYVTLRSDDGRCHWIEWWRMRMEGRRGTASFFCCSFEHRRGGAVPDYESRWDRRRPDLDTHTHKVPITSATLNTLSLIRLLHLNSSSSRVHVKPAAAGKRRDTHTE